MLWQRLANEARLSEADEHLKSTSQQLSSVSRELESRSAKEAIERLQSTMQDAQQRVLMRVFHRWSCASASLHENEVVSREKDAERESALAELQSKHEQRRERRAGLIDRGAGAARAGDGGEAGDGGVDGESEAEPSRAAAAPRRGGRG